MLGFEHEHTPQRRSTASETQVSNAALPLWPVAVRGIPNVVLRSALCAAIGKGKRAYFERKHLASFKNISILYTGQQLDQGDLSVWLMILHYSRLQRTKAGEPFRFTAYSMLKALKKNDTGGNRQVLHKRLLRLKANGVEVIHEHRTYVGSLLTFFERDQGTGEYVTALDAQLIPFFAPDQFTQINWDVRLKLEGKPLAQWLHGFYESHAVPFKLGVASLMKWSGSENINARSAGQKLRKALDAVEEACKQHGQTMNYKIERGNVLVRWES